MNLCLTLPASLLPVLHLCQQHRTAGQQGGHLDHPYQEKVSESRLLSIHLISSTNLIWYGVCFNSSVLLFVALPYTPLFRLFSAAFPLHCHSSESLALFSPRGWSCEGGLPPLSASLAAQSGSQGTSTIGSIRTSGLT